MSIGKYLAENCYSEIKVGQSGADVYDINGDTILKHVERKKLEIKRVTENDRIGEFINVEFSQYATDCDVALNFEEFCFVAEDDGKIAGVITGRAYYNEVHIGDLIVGMAYRRYGVGSKLVEAVENAYKDKGYEKIALTTFGFQAPGFYKKLGYELEFVRKDKDPKLSKYFFLKKLHNYYCS